MKQRNLLRRVTLSGALCLIALTFSLAGFSIADAQSNLLRVQGVTLVNGAGDRFIVKGVNMETWRDPGCTLVTLEQYAMRDEIAARMSSLGINAVRMNYSQSWLYQGENLSKFLDLAETLVGQGMYVMPTDHTFTGKSLGNRKVIYPMFQSIIEGMRERGLEEWLIFNPYNEPGPVDGWPSWIAAQIDTLDFLRETVGYKGVVVLDARVWSADFDIPSYKEVMAHDATLLDGTPNVVFSNHWYPNIGLSGPQNVSNNAGSVPVIMGELGQFNPGSSPVTPQYAIDVLDNLVEVGIPRGHNGAFGWLWSWCDRNSMTNVGYLNLTRYGQIYVDHLYSKIEGNEPVSVGTNTPMPTPSITTTP